MEKLLSTREVANILNCHINSVWDYIHKGRLVAIRLGKRRWKIKQSDLQKFIDSSEQAQENSGKEALE